MAERKAGPVKPPVIDLKARETTAAPAAADAADSATPAAESTETGDPTGATETAATRPEAAKPVRETKSTAGAKSAAEAESEAKAAAETRPGPEPRPRHTSWEPESHAAPPEPPKPAVPPPAMQWGPLAGAAIAGAVLGTALTFALASVVRLPSPVAPIADPTPVLTSQAAEIAALTDRLQAIEGSTTRTQVSLDATITQLDAGLNELRQSLADVKAAIPAPVSVDLSGIEAELKTLKARIDGIAAGASTTDADAMAQHIAAIEGDLSGLKDTISGYATTLGTLQSGIDANKAALAAHIAAAAPSEIGPALKLPLLLSGLESAFAGGHSFVTELASLKDVLPELEIAPALQNAAAGGLLRPDALDAEFQAVLPDMLGQRGSGSTGDWAQDAINWGKALLALRPIAEVDGNTPDAIVSRLEGAMTRRDYVAADALMQQLPPGMQEAAGNVPAELGAHAAADSLIAELRARALAPIAGAAQ